MEKLQKALQKARESREGQALDARPAVTAARAPVSTEGPWAELAPFTPDPAVLHRHRIFSYIAQKEAAPFDVLRTKVFLAMRQNGWTRLAITSPEQGCGKSTVACNLAFGLSRQTQTRTMLLDLDMRRPGVAALLGCRPQHNMRDMLTGQVSPQDHMLCVNGNLALAMSGGSTADPTDILTARQTGEVLDTLQARYAPHVMIFDLGPMLQTDDARAVLKYVDCALVLAKAEQTRASHLDTCEREVGQLTNVLGVVLNDCRHVEAETDYYYQGEV